MNVDETSDGVTPEIDDGVKDSEKVETTQKADDKVDFSSFKRAVDEKKRAQEKVDELAAKVKTFEESELERKGNTDQIIKNLRTELENSKTELKSLKGATTWDKIESQIQKAAIKAGCKNADKLMKLIDSEDIKAMEIDDKIRIHNDDLNRLIDKAKSENDFLFGKGSVKVVDGQPKGEIQQKGLKDLTANERKALRAKLKNDKFY